MAERCPHSPRRGSGWLEGWRLAFGGEDLGWEGALATVFEESGQRVFVVLYDLSDSDEESLDQWDGVSLGFYRKAKVRVETMDGDVLAWLYVLTPTKAGCPPRATWGSWPTPPSPRARPRTTSRRCGNGPAAEGHAHFRYFVTGRLAGHRGPAPRRGLRVRRGRGAAAASPRRRTPAELDAMVDRRVAGPAAGARPGLGRVLRPADRRRARGLRAAAAHRVPGPRRPSRWPAPGRGRRRPVLRLGRGRRRAGRGAWTGLELHAVDIDPAAVRCARRNLAAAGGQVYAGRPLRAAARRLRGRVDVLVANAPYVPTDEIGLHAAGGPAARAAGGARRRRGRARRAAPGDRRRRRRGWPRRAALLVETSERQAPRAAEAMTGAGLVPRVASSGEMGATVVIGTRADQAR